MRTVEPLSEHRCRGRQGRTGVRVLHEVPGAGAGGQRASVWSQRLSSRRLVVAAGRRATTWRPSRRRRSGSCRTLRATRASTTASSLRWVRASERACVRVLVYVCAVCACAYARVRLCACVMCACVRACLCAYVCVVCAKERLAACPCSAEHLGDERREERHSVHVVRWRHQDYRCVCACMLCVMCVCLRVLKFSVQTSRKATLFLCSPARRAPYRFGLSQWDLARSFAAR